MCVYQDPEAFEDSKHSHPDNCRVCQKKILKEIRERLDKQAMEGFQDITVRVFANVLDSDCPKCGFPETVRIAHVPEGASEPDESIHTCRKCKHDFDHFKK